MKNIRGEQGSTDVLLVPVILLAILFIVAAGFAVWSFSGRQTYKNDSDAKVATAVAASKQTVQAADAKQAAEAAKDPLKTFVGPDAYSSVHLSYPKTWSAYIDTNGSLPLDAYFHDDYVPATDSKQTYNLRVQILASSYSSQIGQYTSLVTGGTATAQPYSLPKVPSVTGMELTGQVVPDNSSATGTMVVLPMRDATLLVWTESPTYLADFNAYILPNLTFSP